MSIRVRTSERLIVAVGIILCGIGFGLTSAAYLTHVATGPQTLFPLAFFIIVVCVLGKVRSRRDGEPTEVKWPPPHPWVDLVRWVILVFVLTCFVVMAATSDRGDKDTGQKILFIGVMANLTGLVLQRVVDRRDRRRHRSSGDTP